MATDHCSRSIRARIVYRMPLYSTAWSLDTNQKAEQGVAFDEARRLEFIFWGEYIIRSGYGRPPCLLQGQSRKVSPSFARVAERFIR